MGLIYLHNKLVPTDISWRQTACYIKIRSLRKVKQECLRTPELISQYWCEKGMPLIKTLTILRPQIVNKLI